DFAAFLRAGSDDRRVLLERLFGTERFAHVEWWLRDRARIARTELNDQLGAVRDVVSRLSQAAGEPAAEQGELEPAGGRGAGGGPPPAGARPAPPGGPAGPPPPAGGPAERARAGGAAPPAGGGR